jgi:AcrR family transcriptional regulator
MTSRAYSSAARDTAAEKTRSRILAAAIRHLRAKGAGGFSLDGVARKAKVTRLTVYNQFGSRRALLEAVFDNYAMRGGLNRLAEAMGAPEPRAGLERLVEIFCDFWSFDHEAFAGLLAMAAGTEFETAVRARNERRRTMIVILLDRMAKGGEIATISAPGLVDVLFALTSFPFFAELARDRTKQTAAAQVKMLAGLALADAIREKKGKASRKGSTGLEPAG